MKNASLDAEEGTGDNGSGNDKEIESVSENEREINMLKKSLCLSKNMFVGNDILTPFNYSLLAYDTNINDRIAKVEEDEDKRIKDLKEISTLAIADGNATKSQEEMYKENELNSRKQNLRENVIKKLTSIKVNINIKELDEYSSVKKLYLKKMEKDDTQRGKERKKKKKKSSIISSIINDDTVTQDDIGHDLNYMNESTITNQMGELAKNNNEKNSILPFVDRGKNEVHSGPIIKKSDDSVLSSDALKNIKTLDIYKKIKKPKWHFPYKLYRVILGHSGWVNCVDVDISNEWFATGANDRLIKIWDLATCKLKLTLTGHINSIRDIKISKRNPYLFSCGEDNRVKCWDLEYNKVIRDYHGHLSGVYCLSLHPSLDILMSGGRDAVVRVWDIRTKSSVFVLSGHTGTIMSLCSQSVEPQVVSGSQDKMIRLWDLNNGKCRIALTHHKKSIRSLSIHPFEYSFCSCGTDNVKVWCGADAEFDRNITGFNSIINCSLIKQDSYFSDSSILILGSNNGQLHFYDWSSGYKYDTLSNKVVPGTVECENSTLAMAFDKSESRLITTHGDKSIKIWRENEDATPENFPIKWNPYESFKF
ncbi:regulatory protein, putative [Plasmodium knowlesi strain H]|uniref:Regulatory protein, putative n=3 Tax=Plasmodium knowlesi TaxID=5850 RepID=A0A5K1UIX6_PLAKH|nr:pre-mRNA-splicing factor PRP46, putative [Plasmodium knowlesi strain H]OTN66126.1 putative Regulatory protein [Plasmodium knowlesi]CAA9988045.1 pre-mRNA-splicing factor PRP46, putative [Plasmodium knowlesi strain H]SBO21958.1 regulatory protein, putative [Plasmodium knowlesi strain H]SBO29500.1 regulatory protein, putative [Plasmodium knowlesi strain H]VVS77519.1 pre-mRNA-splicing factor PRP46, putative [Plasmodium knowlesi strain H]|eukprot:XP_002259024.1 regulatory protein, putative [Plasmodium knowlesi strain H]